MHTNCALENNLIIVSETVDHISETYTSINIFCGKVLRQCALIETLLNTWQWAMSVILVSRAQMADCFSKASPCTFCHRLGGNLHIRSSVSLSKTQTNSTTCKVKKDIKTRKQSQTCNWMLISSQLNKNNGALFLRKRCTDVLRINCNCKQNGTLRKQLHQQLSFIVCVLCLSAVSTISHCLFWRLLTPPSVCTEKTKWGCYCSVSLAAKCTFKALRWASTQIPVVLLHSSPSLDLLDLPFLPIIPLHCMISENKKKKRQVWSNKAENTKV